VTELEGIGGNCQTKYPAEMVFERRSGETGQNQRRKNDLSGQIGIATETAAVDGGGVLEVM